MSICVRRREFIAGIGGAAAWPALVRAQQPLPVIGYLSVGSSNQPTRDSLRTFHQGLNDAGFFEGRNVAIQYRWAEAKNDRLPALAADLIRRQVTVIAGDGPAALAAKAITATIPIVFWTGGDPIEMGLVASLNRPGGNVTGATSLAVEIGPKHLELLHELLPQATVLGLLVNPSYSISGAISRELQAAASTLGLQLHVMRASTEGEITDAFTSFVHLRVGGLVIGGDPFFGNRVQLLAALALRHALPAIYAYRGFADAGGLMAYGGNIAESYRLAGFYSGRVIKGEKPALLPVQQSTKVRLVINLNTAKALGLDIPATIYARADEVIE
jgi:putative ABC transport system substrate-binding protein